MVDFSGWVNWRQGWSVWENTILTIAPREIFCIMKIGMAQKRAESWDKGQGYEETLRKGLG